MQENIDHTKIYKAHLEASRHDLFDRETATKYEIRKLVIEDGKTVRSVFQRAELQVPFKYVLASRFGFVKGYNREMLTQFKIICNAIRY